MPKVKSKYAYTLTLGFFVQCVILWPSFETYAQQQTYTLETSTFRLVFNRFTVAGDGYATGLREVRYLPTGRLFTVSEAWTNIANVDSSWWDDPDSVSVVQVTQYVQDITIHYGPGKRSTMRVTSHPTFLEFQLTDVTGNCGEIRMFGPIFLGLSPNDWPGWDPIIRYEYNQITYLGNGYYACFIAANPNTYPARHWEDSTSVLIRAISPKYIPTQGGSSYRNQRFAFFLCQEEDRKNRVSEVEQYFDIPYGVALKDNLENDIDYLFLMDESYVPAQNIIQLCRETNLGAVLLYQGYWSAWRDPAEPFKLQWWTSQVVDSLKAAGLIVGLHAYVHLVPWNGYFATRYPDSVSTCIIDGTFKSMKWETSIPDSVVHRFVDRVEALHPDWLYLDGQEKHYECQPTSYDTYLDGRQTWAVMAELRRRNYTNLKIFQDAGGTLTYHFKSRIGQTDYWDGVPWHRNPIDHMNFTASQAIHRRRGLYRYTDLGWFGREIHIPGGRRDARWDEWQHLATTSLTYNIPVGIRTTYNDFMTDTLRNRIIPLLRETIGQRRGLVGIPVEVISGWNMLSSPVTVIGDSVRQLFPSSQFPYAFLYDSSGGYIQSYRLENGIGYWLRFLSAGTYLLTGVHRPIDTVSVRPGWNMIGSISEPIATPQISSIPPSMITSQFFHFDVGGYGFSDTIHPGKGYWVKVNSSGMLVLGSNANPITIVPISEQPPDPPEVVGIVPDETLPLRLALHQNYPNPFNPQTIIRFELPRAARIDLTLYNILGQKIKTLASGVHEAGMHSVTLEAGDLPSGIYFYRLTTPEAVLTHKLLIIK
jgi:hypothetical protein